MKPKRHPLHFYVDRLEQGEAFTLTRYGDGEFLAIFGYKGRNCDGHEYFPALGADLRRTLEDPRPYYYGIGPKATRWLRPRIDAYAKKHDLARLDWHYTDTFVEASVAGTLWPLVKVLGERRTLYVGPSHLTGRPGKVAGLFPVVGTVSCPPVNAYLVKDDLLTAIRERIDILQPQIVGFSAGMLSEVLIWELWADYGKYTSFIDFGSVFDPYAGRISRTYHKKHDWNRLRELNTGRVTI